MEKSLINPLKEAQKEYQELIGKYGKLYSENCCLKLSILEIKEENERLKQELLTYKNAICNKECAEVWGESERLKEENEQLKKDNTELCERLEAVAKESGKALTRQIIAESMVADLQKEKVVWHDLRKNPNDLPKVDMLVRVRLSSGMEHICETDYYEPSEDEIGYGKLIISFYELNGKWIDDTEIIAWCEIPKFEVEE